MQAMHLAPVLAPALLFAASLWPSWGLSQSGTSVYRCGNSYSVTPCAGGHVIEDKLSTLHGSTTAAPGQATVFLCQSQGGGQFWSAKHCGQHQALIERMETVPASLPWPQQVQQAQRQWEQAEANQLPYAPAPLSRSQQTQLRAHAARQEAADARRNSSASTACTSLRARLAALDSQGRAGSLHTDLDRLRAERRTVRSEYRRLGC